MNVAPIEGLRIHYEHHRPPVRDAGCRVLFIHGTGCNAQVFTRHLRVLAERHEVAAIDLPGHGQSSGTGFRGAVDHAYIVAGLIEHLGWDPCVLAGHSLGGGIALAAAVYCPARVAALLLIDTGARLRVDPAILEYARRVACGEHPPITNRRMGFADSTAQAIVDDVNAMTAACDPTVLHKDWIADDSFDFMNRLAHIRVPALAVCGADDRFTPLKYHEYLRDHLPDCRLEVIPGAGHWPFVEQPQAFDASVLRFLDYLSGR